MKAVTVSSVIVMLISVVSHATTFTQGHNMNGHVITNASMITASGPVGIGTHAPRVLLDVVGHAALGNAFGVDPSVNASNSVLTIQNITTNYAQVAPDYSDLYDAAVNIKQVARPAAPPQGIKQYRGIYTVAQAEKNVNYFYLAGVQGEALFRGEGYLNRARGIVGAAINESNGVVNSAVGGAFIVAQNWNMIGNCIISNAVGVLIDSGFDNGGTTINRAGLQIRACPPSSQNTALVVLGTDTLPSGHFAVYNDSPLSNYFRGRLGSGTSAPTAQLDVNGTTGYNQLRLRSSYTPTGTSDPNGAVGDIAWDENYFYVKTPSGWKRALLSTW